MTIQINAATLAFLVLTILWMPNIWRFAIAPFVIIAGAINAVIFSFFYTLYRLVFTLVFIFFHLVFDPLIILFCQRDSIELLVKDEID